MKRTMGEKIFSVFNYIFLFALSIVCILPILNLLATSFSSSVAIESGNVSFIPVDFTLNAYEYVLKKSEFITAMGISFVRVFLAVVITLILTVMMAYPLSKNKNEFKYRNIYANILIITMLFGAGMIPSYLVVKSVGLMNTIWALIIPIAVSPFYIILMQNFFRTIPKELEEVALIDGANQFKILFKIFVPLSKPSIVTIILFIIVGHWNSWFDGLIYLNSSKLYPLQTYLQTILINSDVGISNRSHQDIRELANICTRNGKAAQIFISLVPILVLYPFLQKYFTKGIMLGSVKG